MPHPVTVAAALSARAPMPMADRRLVPADVLKRLMNSENPLRVWRQHRGYSLAAVSERSGLAISYLIELECGEREPSPWVVGLVAKAIDVPASELFG